MLITVQIPFADARPFLGSETSRLGVPGWPHPQVDVEFVRAVGAVRERRRGGLAPWLGEGYYADAARALRFPPGFGRWPFLEQRKVTRMHCAFRRFFSDGAAVARVEVGFGPRNQWYQLEPLDGTELVGLLASCLAVPVEVPTENGDRAGAEMVAAGRKIAKHLLRSTTVTAATAEPEAWWLRALRPMAIVHYQAEELSGLPPHSTEVSLGPATPLHYTVLARGGISIPVWLVSWDDVDDLDQMRRIRLHLSRLHAEREALKWILSLASEGRLAGADGGEAWDRLQYYLNNTFRTLRSDAGYGIENSAELKSTLRLGDLVNPGDRESLLMRLEGMRTNILRKVEEASSEQGRQASIHIEQYIDQKNSNFGDISMDDHSFNAGNISGSTVIAGSGITITDSFNQIDQSSASSEVKDVLKELVQAVGQLDDSVPLADREAAGRDLDGLMREATAEKPRRDSIESLGDGLIQTAKKIGKVALPVIKLATQLILLFG